MSKMMCMLAAVGASAALIQPTVANAQDTRSVVVSYGDLNLSSPAAVKTLDGRIKSAARDLCGTNGSRDMIGNQLESSCNSAAVASAKPAFDAAVRAARAKVTVIGAATLTVSAQ